MTAPSERPVDRAFVADDGTPRLARCALLFLDLLGVAEMALGADAGKRLIELERATRKMFRDFLAPASPWPATMFSDTLVMASPIEPNGGEEAAIGGLIIQACWLQLNLAASGIFARGAITLGNFYIRNELVFGPALVEAYRLERDAATHPRILLSEKAAESQRAALEAYSEPEESPEALLLIQDGDGLTFLNYLGLLLDEPEDPRPAVALHRDAVADKLVANSGRSRVWEKYRWVAEYHNAFCGRAFPSEDDLLVRDDAIERKFHSFG